MLVIMVVSMLGGVHACDHGGVHAWWCPWCCPTEVALTKALALFHVLNINHFQ
jgi:hypothetical protein